jgi:hypothetical protein
MAKPNFTPPIGGLATNRYDFEEHIEGLAFRHNSDQIDVDPAVNINGTQYITVSTALTAISGNLLQLEGDGKGFITIGDGYDCYHNANGTVNFDPTIPPIDTILNPIFSAIINNTPLPPQYSRIQRGGVVLLKSGTYYVVNTINVPPGITILGEGYGTKIVNATSLVIPPTAGNPPYPKAVSTAAPVFQIFPDINRLSNDGAININAPFFMFGRSTKFYNLVIGDNFIEPTILGDVNYKLPQNYAVNVPLILQEQGSFFECSNVSFVGRVNFTSGQTVGSNGVSSYAVQLDSNNPVSSGTILKVRDCFFDGFALASEFRGTGYNADVCEFINNKIRVYGYLGNNSSSAPNNCVLSTTPCNTEFSDNYVVGNGNNVLTGVYVDATGVSIPANKNLMPRAQIVGNTGVVNKTSGFAGVSNNLNVSIFNTNEATPQTIILATISNNTFGSDSSNQRTIVNNTTTLQQLDDTSMANGSIVWVSVLEEHFYLDRGTIANGLSVDGVNVFATASGNGKWVRLLYFTAGGDLSGKYPNPTVVGIQTRPVSNTAPSTSQVLAWNGSQWIPTTLSSSAPPSGAAGGDLGGSYPNPTVVQLQTRPVSSSAPSVNQVLEWNGSQWAPTNLPSGLPPSGAAGGDLAGTYPNPTVVKLQTRPVSAAAPLSGDVLAWSGSQWQPTPTDGPSAQQQATNVDIGNANLAPLPIGGTVLTTPPRAGFVLVQANFIVKNAFANYISTAVLYGLGINTVSSFTIVRQFPTFATLNVSETTQGVGMSYRFSAAASTTYNIYPLLLSSNHYNPNILTADADVMAWFMPS